MLSSLLQLTILCLLQGLLPSHGQPVIHAAYRWVTLTMEPLPLYTRDGFRDLMVQFYVATHGFMDLYHRSV